MSNKHLTTRSGGADPSGRGMGKVVDGPWRRHAWRDDGFGPDEGGEFKRPKTQFRSRVAADGSTDFAPEAGRYHIYAAYACPWAQRALITRAVRGLEDAIDVTIVDPKMGRDGWAFSDPDPLFGAHLLRQIYWRASPRYDGRVTVPVLWDKTTGRIVNNESREVMRMLDTEFDGFAKNPTSLAPPELRGRVDETLDALYEPLNNGVYRTGFATTQEAYEKACTEVFEALDHWDAVLARQRYLCGDVLTEADVALFTTCLRFDLVYYAHFKCNVRRLRDYPNVWGFVRDLYQRPLIKQTCRLDHIKTHYYWSQANVNPHRIVPLGPTLDLDAPHDRARLSP